MIKTQTSACSSLAHIEGAYFWDVTIEAFILARAVVRIP